MFLGEIYLMKDYTIVEECTLPSLGKIYTPKINPEVKLRSMTTVEEMRRLAPSEHTYKNLCELIDDCMVEPIGMSVYDMHLADYQYLLHRLRIVTYGVDYKYESSCPWCGQTTNGEVDLTTFPIKYFEDGLFDNLVKFTLPVSKKEIEINIQTPRNVDNVNKLARDNKHRYSSSAESLFIYTLMSMIKTVDNEKLDVIQLERFVKSLPMKDTNFIIKHAEKIVESFGMDTTLKVKCSGCGLDYTVPFRITSDFFSPTI